MQVIAFITLQFKKGSTYLSRWRDNVSLRACLTALLLARISTGCYDFHALRSRAVS